ncbi:MAG: sigma-54-dependent Fis family transcriptional regulator [Methylococcales bacterium]|nr:sigma-54-dependent Fis family transcriptional regulator [Methylococcales bacterium]
MALPRLLLIDDNRTRIQQFESVLLFLEYQVSSASSDDYISVLADLNDVRAVFIGNGCEKQATLIKSVLSHVAELPVILLIEKGTTPQVPSAIQKMVTQCQEWPSSYPVFIETIKKLPVPKKPVITQKNSASNKGLAGISQSIKQIRELIDQVAGSNATVLVLGESGTGKEVVAQALHRASDRKNRPFVPVNCGAIPGELLESELFGHEKGAFTGALTARQGRFEMAEGGTLFLDEIGDMPMPMQVKLLRVLQERTFERVGSNKTIECDVRIVAATHRNLESEIQEKRFREDLFYRLNVFPIELPSLKEREEDIPLLVNDLVARMEVAKKGKVEFTKEALALMMQHPWPGNVRELSNFIERLAITNPNGIIEVSDLPTKFQQYEIPEGFDIETVEDGNVTEEVNPVEQSESANVVEESPVLSQLPKQGLDLKEYLSDMEINLIQQALNECNGVVAHAAKRLNMRRTTLVEKLKKYEMS